MVSTGVNFTVLGMLNLCEKNENIKSIVISVVLVVYIFFVRDYFLSATQILHLGNNIYRGVFL